MSFLDTIGSVVRGVVKTVADRVEDIVTPDPPAPPPAPTPLPVDERIAGERSPSYAPLPACAPPGAAPTPIAPQIQAAGTIPTTTLGYLPAGGSTVKTLEYHPSEGNSTEMEPIAYYPGAESGTVGGRPIQVAGNGRGRGPGQPPAVLA